MTLREKIERTKDLWSMNLADILPKRAVYWIAMRQIGKATMTSQNVPATSLDNVLENLGNVREGKPLEQFKWHASRNVPEDHSVHIHVNPEQLMVDDVRRNAEEALRRQGVRRPQ